MRGVQGQGSRWDNWPKRDWTGRSVEEIMPPTFPTKREYFFFESPLQYRPRCTTPAFSQARGATRAESFSAISRCDVICPGAQQRGDYRHPGPCVIGCAPVDDQSLYWTLSTLPQVCAALVAFIGFLILQSLDEPTRRREFFYSECRGYVLANGTTQESALHAASKNIIFGMEPATFMAHFELAVQKRQLKGGVPEWAGDYHLRWSETNRYIERARARLAKFVTLNLVVILASLLLLPIVPKIADYGLAMGLVFGAAGIALVEIVRRAGAMIHAAIEERRL